MTPVPPTDTCDTNVLGVEPDLLADLEQLAPGVRGYTIDTPECLSVPLIIADNPGAGDVSRYLDSLPRDRTVKVPNVLAGRLFDMLARRSFVARSEWSQDAGEHVEVMVREPVAAEIAQEITWLRRALRSCQEAYHREAAARATSQHLSALQGDVVEAAEDMLERRSSRAINDARQRLRVRLNDLHRLESR